MPLLTDYWFRNWYWYGQFEQFNQPFNNDGESFSAPKDSSSAATLTWVREDNEQIIQLTKTVQNPAITNTVKDILKGTKATLSSDLKAHGIFWKDVYPYNDPKDSHRHQPRDMLVRVYFTIHIHHPKWYCTDADAALSYYLLFWLDEAGYLHGSADYATSFLLGGGWPFCQKGIENTIRKAMQDGMPRVQNVLDQAIKLGASGKYSMQYFLPGDGTRTDGHSNQNGFEDVALVLLPT
ncbi:hypothetical protein AB0L00_23010 [Actinoallomurus sp. NPDC052308]|uniref:hypothetical protein n=1 Tax=Actinoallomurus sp. NPDC052308 TaxID=3155530 RepID=UPI003436F39B